MDAHVLELLEVVKREDFVPLAHKALAFVDMEIPLREGGARGQVMLAPRVEARLLQDANVQKHEKVLEIGAGSGYMAALLAHRAQRVVSLEIEPELARMARANLQKAGIHNAEVLEIDGAAGVKGDGPFDVIVLSGSVVEVPQVLMAQVKIGGRLIGIVGDEPMMYATVLTRTGESTWTTVQQWDTVVPRLLNFEAPSKFRF
jgi:protein-L-isoaspartate(D-aspartate) O-methyltransferase